MEPDPSETKHDAPEPPARGRMSAWLLARLERPSALRWLAALSFAESSFFPIPPDFLMAPLILRHPERWMRIAALVTVSSVAGGLFGYLIGAVFFELAGGPLVAFYHLEEELLVVGSYFADHSFLAVFTAAFTPVPYKLFTIAAGLFRVDLAAFLLASLLGRGLRYLLVGFVANRFGEKLSALVMRYFNLVTLVLGALALLYGLFQIVN